MSFAYSCHIPVLLTQALAALAIRPGGIYVDCTFGRGGHSRELLACVGPTGRVFALDKDPEAVRAGEDIAARDPRFVIEKASFAKLADFTRTKWIVADECIFGRVDGVLFDLGISSPQLADPDRGFGFMTDGPLDMRMDPSTGLSAAQWLASASEGEIRDVLRIYGEERHARRIARAIVGERQRSPIETTGRLAGLVARISHSRERNKHPATRTFQAIRIHINQELDELKDTLEQVLGVLAPGGRFAIISFHSLEDRLVKRFIRTYSREIVPPRRLPVMPNATLPLLVTTQKRPVRPSTEEIAGNPRARSALLRTAQKRS
uniref:Ribosomal RNA small subunit methyltransferase H n=1 Tax=Candidatus Kentrum sp. FM TaxID=2126340 RepID=A0A450S7J4_9GAMM|nr:MAG: 16S rRNA (cytosine1402-N4)-methyltransferase [Candidatus Kentron sp. FM]VFJ62896.1 MAG: 16S rRNA (cytosine1402-N4)-methyltransferase [Candidatus Kentron sp. FM]VFK07766.1 MAG: 16S rRNA (cytosine1402-N4)-methyltransferase [Candidatus Kentron sp. FM]